MYSVATKTVSRRWILLGLPVGAAILVVLVLLYIWSQLIVETKQEGFVLVARHPLPSATVIRDPGSLFERRRVLRRDMRANILYLDDWMERLKGRQLGAALAEGEQLTEGHLMTRAAPIPALGQRAFAIRSHLERSASQDFTTAPGSYVDVVRISPNDARPTRLLNRVPVLAADFSVADWRGNSPVVNPRTVTLGLTPAQVLLVAKTEISMTAGNAEAGRRGWIAFKPGSEGAGVIPPLPGPDPLPDGVIQDLPVKGPRLPAVLESELASKLPPGTQTYTIATSPEHAVGGLIMPGYRVDVVHAWIVAETAQATFLIQNARVLAVNEVTADLPDRWFMVPEQITLEVTPNQAARLDHAVKRGEIRFALRAPDDTGEAKWDAPADSK